jgi:methyl-accepting chemotaxis protein
VIVAYEKLTTWSEDNNRVWPHDHENNLIDTGNWIGLATYKARAIRDPGIMPEALSKFDHIEKQSMHLKDFANREEDLKRIEGMRAAAVKFRTAMNDILDQWMAGEEASRKLQESGEHVIETSTKNATVGMDRMARTLTQTVSSISTVLISGLAIAVLFGILSAIGITFSITRPLRRVIVGLSLGAEQLSEAAKCLASSSQELADGASQQTSVLEETSAAIEQMANISRQNAEKAGEANSFMTETLSLIDRSTGAMNELIQR